MNFTFCGCSYTVGVGLDKEKSSSDNYVNIIGNKYNANVKNIAQGGNSNYNIFISALTELIYGNSSHLFVQWSALNRLWLYPGPDTCLFLPIVVNDSYNYRDIKYTKKELQKFANTYHMLNHDYHNILELIKYVNILTSCAEYKTQIIFINGLIPWTKEISNIDTKENYALNLSNYTKEILEFDTRNDNELDDFFINLNLEINKLDFDKWPNIFNSLRSMVIDLGTDKMHPGIKSHKQYADMIIKYLETQ